MKKLTLKVTGMTCASCEIMIERALRKVTGVQGVHVNRAKEKVHIHCEDQIQLEELKQQLVIKDIN